MPVGIVTEAVPGNTGLFAKLIVATPLVILTLIWFVVPSIEVKEFWSVLVKM